MAQDNNFTAGDFVVNSSVIYGENTKIDNENYVGEISLFTSVPLPAEYLLCDGSQITSTENNGRYSKLVQVLGGINATSCHLPNFDDKHPLGWDGSFNLFQHSGNANEDGSNTLTIDHFPAHSHRVEITYNVTQNAHARVNGVSGATIGNYTNNNMSKKGDSNKNMMPINTHNHAVSLSNNSDLNIRLSRTIDYTIHANIANNNAGDTELRLTSYKLFFGIRFK